MNTTSYWRSQNFSHWLRPITIAGVLLVSAILPLKVPSLYLMGAIGLPFVIGAALAVLRWPQLGLLGLIGISLLVPIDGPGGVNASLGLLALLIGLWFLDMMARQRGIRLASSRTILPLFVFMVVAIIAFAIGQLSWFNFAQPATIDAQVGGLAIFLLSAGAFLLVGHQVDDIKWLKWLIWLFLGIAGFIVFGRYLRLGFIMRRLIHPGVGGSMFWTWLIALAFSQALLNRKLHIIWRLALGGLVLLTLYDAAILNRDWKSGWIPAFVVIAAIIGIRSWRTGLILAIVGALPAFYLLLNALSEDAYSYETRVDAWLVMAEIIKANPLLGLGFANYYWYTPLFPIRGFAVQFNSHNNYVDIVAQTGLIGLVCFLWIAWEIGWLGWRLRTRVPDGFPRAYVYGALGGLIGTLASAALGDWVLPFVYNVGLGGFRASVLAWLFLGGLLALERICANQKSADKKTNNYHHVKG